MGSPFRHALAAVGVALVLLLEAAGSARAQGGVYVALGDSYTSAPLVLNQHGSPIDCARSDHNYSSLVAQALHVATFVDVSCGSAQTKDMFAPQTGLPLGGTNPPQFDALRPDASLVTVGIGGNDAGLVGVAEKCAQLGLLAPTGTACRHHYAPGGQDSVAGRIEATKPKIDAVLEGIHRRSPLARVAIVGYPDVLPAHGGCYPVVPLSPDDVRYIDELIRRINAMIAGQAALHGAEFVDTYRDSGGHDVCALPPNRWFEGLIPTEPAFPLHPNGKGEASMARSALAVLSRPRPAPVLSRLRVSPARVRSGRALTIRYRLDRPARVTVTVRRAHARRFLLTSRSAGRAGDNRLVLSARRIGRRAGRYGVVATPSADGRRGRSAVRSFTLSTRRQ